MHVAQLLNPLLPGPHIEIIKACLPERPACFLAEWHSLLRVSAFSFWQQSLRTALLQHLHHCGGRAYLRFRDQQMNVLRHYHIADHNKAVTLARLFKRGQEVISGSCCAQQGPALMARVSDKVQVMRTISAMQSTGHKSP